MRAAITYMITCTLLGTVIYLLSVQLIASRDDNTRLKSNIAAVTSRIEYYKSVNGEIVANTRVIEAKLNELKTQFPAVLQEIRNLKIKSGRVEAYAETRVQTEKHIITTLRDSVRLIDNKLLRQISYSDTYYTLKGTITGDTAALDISSRDTLLQVVYRGKRYKPYLWIFSRRRLEQSIRTANPNNYIVYSRFIKITK